MDLLRNRCPFFTEFVDIRVEFYYSVHLSLFKTAYMLTKTTNKNSLTHTHYNVSQTHACLMNFINLGNVIAYNTLSISYKYSINNNLANSVCDTCSHSCLLFVIFSRIYTF